MSDNTTTDPAIPVDELQLQQFRRDATVMELATVIAASRDFPDCRTPEKAAVRILAGREMGVGPIASIIGIRFQAGRKSIDATLMAGCIKRSNVYDYKIITHSDETCELAFFENGESAGLSTFTIADAKKAGLVTKDIWKNYPRNMLFARALSNGARWFCPMIFDGAIYTHEELGLAVDEEGRAIECEAGVGNELCTRDQRQQIINLVAAVGDTMPKFMEKMGIKLLDELSQREAIQEIKKLEKKLNKAGTPAVADGEKQTGLPTPVVAVNATSPAPAVQPDALTPAQQMIADATTESCQASTPEQRELILSLAATLVPDEDECHEMLVAALAKRHARKMANLNHLQAAALIEALQAKIKEAKSDSSESDETPPFVPTPAK
jgi:hypothetical protein